MIITPTEQLVMAVTVAVATMDGTAGGYSPSEKQAAKDEMLKLQTSLIEGWRNEHTT